MVLLEVSDKGHGICVNERGRSGTFPFNIGVGIASMQERIKQVGGRLDIKSSRCGTTVRATIPADD
jgi:signal transduction histidine kinase